MIQLFGNTSVLFSGQCLATVNGYATIKYLEMVLLPLGWMPHGTCFFWNVPLTALHVLSDGLIAIAYFSMPVMIYFNRQWASEKIRPVLLLFAAFIFSCGISHLLTIWNIWHSNYWVEGIEKSITGVVSAFTALYLYSHIPDLLGTQKALELAQHMALTDEMTGLVNRRGLDGTVANNMIQLRTGNMVHSLIMLDLDDFKAINDTCGHSMGDCILKQVAHILQSNIRSLDTAARIGGDEFAVFLPGCPLSQAKEIAERLRHEIAMLNAQFDEVPSLTVSSSIGLLSARHEIPLLQFYDKADQLLYKSKHLGKNQISAQELPT